MAGHGDQCGLGSEVPMRFSTAVFPKTLAWIGSPVSDDGLSEPQAIAFHKHLDPGSIFEFAGAASREGDGEYTERGLALLADKHYTSAGGA